MKEHTRILLRWLTPMLIVTLSWHQLSFFIIQAVKVTHYYHVRSSNPIYKNKLRDTICISKHELKNMTWLEDDEIRYKGKMFDLKRQLQKGENTLLIGHYDSKDDMLLAASFSFFDDDRTPFEHKKNSIKLLLFDAVIDIPHKDRIPLSLHKVITNTSRIHSMCEVIYLANTSPPPELLRVS